MAIRHLLFGRWLTKYVGSRTPPEYKKPRNEDGAFAFAFAFAFASTTMAEQNKCDTRAKRGRKNGTRQRELETNRYSHFQLMSCSVN